MSREISPNGNFPTRLNLSITAHLPRKQTPTPSPLPITIVMSGTGSDAHNAATGLAKGATDALTNTDLASGIFEAPADRVSTPRVWAPPASVDGLTPSPSNLPARSPAAASSAALPAWSAARRRPAASPRAPLLR